MESSQILPAHEVVPGILEPLCPESHKPRFNLEFVPRESQREILRILFWTRRTRP